MAAVLMLGVAQASLLGACSNRDELLSEKVAAAEAAAERAIRAQKAAEQAAKAAGAKINAASQISEPEPEEDIDFDDSSNVVDNDVEQYDEPPSVAEAPPAPPPPAAAPPAA